MVPDIDVFPDTAAVDNNIGDEGLKAICDAFTHPEGPKDIQEVIFLSDHKIESISSQ